MDRKTREELNELSKNVFGTSSRWQKIVNYGVAEPLEREREVMVPTSKGVSKKTFTDKKTVIRRYSVDEVRKLMEGILASRKPAIVTDHTFAVEPPSSAFQEGVSFASLVGDTVPLETVGE